MVSSAKRFLAKPEYRIQLEELFAEETSRALAQLDTADYSAQGRESFPLFFEPSLYLLQYQAIWSVQMYSE